MFNRFKPVPFEPYGRQRSRASLPLWFWMLLIGIAIGGGGVIALQQHYLPPRLTAAESAQLRVAFDRADAERQRLQSALGDAVRQLAAVQADRAKTGGELEASRSAATRLRDEAVALIEALPADPRGGRIEVRAGQFTTRANALFYDLVLVRGEADAESEPLSGVMQMTVTGSAPRGSDNKVTAEPVSIKLGHHQLLQGSVPLPVGFKPSETSIRLFDAAGRTQLGMRVLRVR